MCVVHLHWSLHSQGKTWSILYYMTQWCQNTKLRHIETWHRIAERCSSTCLGFVWPAERLHSNIQPLDQHAPSTLVICQKNTIYLLQLSLRTKNKSIIRNNNPLNVTAYTRVVHMTETHSLLFLKNSWIILPCPEFRHFTSTYATSTYSWLILLPMLNSNEFSSLYCQTRYKLLI